MGGRDGGETESVLRIAAIWGTTVVATATLGRGESFAWDRRPRRLVALPEGLNAAQRPIRSTASGWQVDPYGATAGVLWHAGRDEDPTLLTTKVPIGPGDWGLLQYGSFALFFQQIGAAPPIAAKRRAQWALRVAIAGSVAIHASVFVAVRLLTVPAPLPKPIELVAPALVAARFGLMEMPHARTVPLRAGSAASEMTAWDPSARIDGLKKALRAVRSYPLPEDAVARAGAAPGQLAIVPSASAASDGVSLPALRDAIALQMPAIRSCHERELGSGSEGRGAMDLAIVVRSDGSIQAASVQASTFAGPKLGACIVREARAWRLPVGTADVVVSLRFVPGAPNP
jgi:hypothetical protein